MEIGIVIALLILALIVVVAIAASAIKIVPPYETGIYIRLGKHAGILKPGVNMVTPLVSTVVPVDMRTQSMTVTCRSMRFIDGQKLEGIAVIDYRIRDPAQAYYSVPNARYALADATEKTTRSVIGRAALDEFDRFRDSLNQKLTEAAKRNASDFGVEILSAEIREAGTMPLPLDVPFNRRHTTPKGVLFFDTTDHEGPHGTKKPRSYGDARPWK